MKRIVHFATLASVGIMSLWVVRAQQTGAPDGWTERLLAKVPNGLSPTTRAWDSWISLTPDLSALVYMVRFRSGDHWREAVVIGNQRGPEYTWASRGVISPDGRHVAYIGVETMNNRQLPAFLVLDKARAQIQYRDQRLGPNWIPVFAFDSSKVAFVAERQSGKYSVGVASTQASAGDTLPVDWGPEFTAIDRPVWSPGSTTFAYVGQRSQSEWVVMKGFEQVARFADVADVRFAVDGTLTFRASEDGTKQFMMYGADRHPVFDAITEPTFRSDGTLVYVATEGKKHFAMVGSARIELPQAAEGVAASSDGKRLTHWHREVDSKQRRRMVVNGVAGPYFNRVSKPSIHPETGLYAYTAQNEDKFFVVTPRGSSSAYDGVLWNPKLSDDGARAAYAALKGDEIWWRVAPLK